MHQLTPEQRTDNIKWTCRHHIENYKFLNKLPTGLQKKIMTVKYEVSFQRILIEQEITKNVKNIFQDIAFNPMKMIEQILDFTGLEMTIEIKSWLKENTASSDGGTYSVHRNATESGESLTQLDCV